MTILASAVLLLMGFIGIYRGVNNAHNGAQGFGDALVIIVGWLGMVFGFAGLWLYGLKGGS